MHAGLSAAANAWLQRFHRGALALAPEKEIG